MKCIIAGSRSFAPSPGDSLQVCGKKLNLIDYYIIQAISKSGFTTTQVVSGRAKGIDVGGERWAKRNGIPIKYFPAQWRATGIYNPRAGFERNKIMVDYTDCAVIIWDGQSSGSANTIEYIRQVNKPNYVYVPENCYL